MTRAPAWRRPQLTGGPAVALAYTIIAIVMTWPLMRHPATHIASDLGDSLFICWVLMWTSGQVLRALGGHVDALANYWNGNIFYPAPHTIAYSEHFTPQMLQALPVYALGGNVFLCYNLLFLSTFVVAGLGMYLFVRDVTRRPLAAFLAGLAFAYAPYRLGQFPHLQVMSVGWMPLALLGLRRFFETRRTRALAGGAAAFVVQGLSCGYFLMFFAPVFGAYGMYEIVRQHLIRDWRIWTRLAIAAAGVALVLAPFLYPYIELQRSGVAGSRSLDDAAMFAADTHAFATIAPSARLLGPHLSGYPKPEGEGFPGFTILAFGVVAVVAAAGSAWSRRAWTSTERLAVWSLAAATFVISLAGTLVIFVNGRLVLHAASSLITVQDGTSLMWVAVISGIALAALTRLVAGGDPSGTSTLFWIVVAAAAALLSFGPTIFAMGHLVGHGPYAWMFAHVPGFDGLRVPARFLTIVTLALAILAGAGASTVIGSLGSRTGSAVVCAGIVAMLAESWFAPMALDQRVIPQTLVAPGVPAIGKNLNPLYAAVKSLPGDVVLIEFPFGEEAYDIQATFYAGLHRRPIVNGYSGFFPPGYAERATVLSAAPENPDTVRRSLASSGATHALVHQGAFPDGRGQAIVSWLESLGATKIGQSGLDVLLQLPPNLAPR
jgi:hypothetical protein